MDPDEGTRLRDELARARDEIARLRATRVPEAAGPPPDEARTAAHLRGIIAAASDGIMTIDAEGMITSVNPAVELMFGWPAALVCGRPMHAILPPPETKAGMPADVARADPRRQELEGVRRDGSRFPVELSVSVVPVEDSHFLVVIVRDVTERRLADQVKDEFIATVSHELRTPLAAIRGHLDLVLEGDAGPVTALQQQFLRVASQSTDRLGALINDLLDVERIRSGRVGLRREPVELGPLIREVVATFRLEAERKGLSFREDIGELPVVVADRDRLIQALSNLVSNAIKYTPRGEVGVRADWVDDEVDIEVRDTGIGMSPEDERGLFTRFFRGQGSVVREAGGTGLGVVIARGIVEGHGGRIRVETRQGEGTRFAVRLPAGRRRPAPVPVLAPGQATVLVVEDEDTIRDLLLEQVRLLGHRGVGAGDGQAGLDLARRMEPELVVLEPRVSRPDGWAVLTELRQDPATWHVPVLLHTIVDEWERARELGVTEYLVKPAGTGRVRETIARLLAARPLPIFLLHPDPGFEARLREAMEGTPCLLRQACTLGEAERVHLPARGVVVLHAGVEGGSAASQLATWREDPAWAGRVVVLFGDWPGGVDAGSGAGARRVRCQGRRAADLARAIRSVVEEPRGPGDG